MSNYQNGKKQSPQNPAAAIIAEASTLAPEVAKPVEEFPEALDLRELDLGDPEIQRTITKHWPTLDPYVRHNLWPEWRDRGALVCTQCAHVVVSASGVCSSNPAHKFKPHGANGYSATRVIFR